MSAKLYNVGCVVFIVAGRNASAGWRELQRRTHDAIDTTLQQWASRTRISASDVAAELREKYPDVASSGWFEFETSVAALLRLRSSR